MAPSPPPFFDCSLHPDGLSDDDLETMRLFGLAYALVPSHSVRQTPPAAMLARFDEILGLQLPRLEKAGISACAALGLSPAAIPRRGLSQILSALPEFFREGKVAAVGPVGLSAGGPAELEALDEQLLIAKRLRLPVLVRSPGRGKDAIGRRILQRIVHSGLSPRQILFQASSTKLAKSVLGCGQLGCLLVHPEDLTVERAFAVIRQRGGSFFTLASDAGNGASDILGVPRLLNRLVQAKLSRSLVDRVARRNALEALGRS